ncbi:MAG TPA: ATP-binding protein [Bryobacteraceae bacterium]|jgi:anti-sigma regulatory factor (Ser/Thr protein kinase)|nr:ATP-binding protein [Bryobacteraceae bacterium]
MYFHEFGCMNVTGAREAFKDLPEIEVKSALPGWVCLRIAPRLELRSAVVNFFRSYMHSLATDLCDQLCTALDELLGNALEHGCRFQPKSGCELTYIRTSRMILFQIRDAGMGFDVNGVAHAAINNPPHDPLRHNQARAKMGLRPGGFGILLVKEIADDLIYNEQGNEVVLVKYL